eukprot:767837-Hanusia_phi.AAC.1
MLICDCVFDDKKDTDQDREIKTKVNSSSSLFFSFVLLCRGGEESRPEPAIPARCWRSTTGSSRRGSGGKSLSWTGAGNLLEEGLSIERHERRGRGGRRMGCEDERRRRRERGCTRRKREGGGRNRWQRWRIQTLCDALWAGDFLT